MAVLLAVLAGYLCGSIPFGLLIAHVRKVDLRQVGSGNIGATNAARALGKGFGVLVLVLDALKATVPILVTQRVFAGQLLDLPGSPVFQLAAELGLPFTPCSQQGPDCLPWQNAVNYVEKTAARSRYDLEASNTWLTNLFAAEKAALSHLPILEQVLGLDPATIPRLPAGQRDGAFRMIGVGSYPADGGTIAQLGELAAWDRYYLPFLAESNNAIRSALADHVGIGPDDPHFIDLFLKNLVHVDTFITAAAMRKSTVGITRMFFLIPLSVT